MLKSRKSKTIIIIIVAIFIGMQAFRPNIKAETKTSNLNLPTDVANIIRKDCYDCHSNETNLRWYDQIQPAFSLVANHIMEGRKALNFSYWDTLSADAQKNTLYLAVNQVILGAMPLESYKKFHTDAIPSEQEIAILKKYLLQISPIKISDSAVVNSANEKFTKWMNGNITFNNKVQPAANGIEFINGFQQWKVIAVTDRFDNNSLRVIYGNDIAENAIKSGNINPWPDGTIFAKAAWKSVVDKDENVSPGEFWQVEFMIKDQKKWAVTDGWGWARWRGTDLKPYGAKASFTTECMNCHQPMKDNDFVFTLPFQLKNQQILK